MSALLRAARASGALRAATRDFDALAKAPGARAFSVSAVNNGGMGVPVPPHRPPTAPIPEEAELTWDIGDGNPESALDKVPENVLSKRGAAALLATGLGFFVGLYHFAGYLDKASTVPFAPRTYPYNNLKEELGGHEDGGQPKC